ncbi:MAG TPA: citrate transporter [Candidatus Eisenbergiella merdavium]|uniref:Citrate transporter n=1 Tax=Candidatus Eisenbergiella merdavium TaxID=2838551 RepID=A0A9D2NJQ8_9FIRM|nr:citrate transporter [Candidatus Eisenbergiella merdavium]
MKAVFTLLKKDPVLLISGILAVLSMFFVHPDAAYLSYIDYRVLALLFSLMCVMNGFQEQGVFRKLAVLVLERTTNTRQLTAVLVFLCFFLSMLITNDVALITFVPFTILLLSITGQQKRLIPVIVLQTVAANLGSMLTPIGNPQNLYLYNLSGMSLGAFVSVMLPYTAVSLILLILSLFPGKKEPVSLNSVFLDIPPVDRKKLTCYFVLFLLALCAVLRLLPWQLILAATVISLCFINRPLLWKADYGLLATFVFFFLFIGNMGRLPAVSGLLARILSGHELIVGVLSSQIISNVPSALLLSGFTSALRPLLVGVNLGGPGTLIASLASLISYKQYAQTEGCRKGSYLLVFTAVNLLFLAVLLAVSLLPGDF